MSFVPMLLSLLTQAPAPLSGTAVDREGRPLAGIEIVLAHGQALDGSVPILGRSTTDSRGRYAIAVPAFDQRPAGRVVSYLCAHRPGSGLVASVTMLKNAGPGGFHLAFDTAFPRTLTLRGTDGQPLAGARVAPLMVMPRQSSFAGVMLPAALVDGMEATTGDDGRAKLACLEGTTRLLAVRVTIPGLAAHDLALSPDQYESAAVALDLKPASPITGRVLRDDGRPAVGAEVEVWARSGRFSLLTPVRFEAGPVRTGEDGTFRTPAALLAGLKYRAVIRAQGFKPILTEWVTPRGQSEPAASLPDVVLTPPRSVDGRVVDRHGAPVAGAHVVAAGEEAATLTDEQGKFRLAGLDPTRSLLVVRRDGYHIDGRLQSAGQNAPEVVLARFDEPAARPLTTLRSPVPADERRKLARRVLEPYLVKALAGGKDSDKAWALRSLMIFDPAATLEAIRATPFEKTAYYQSFLWSELGMAMARDDPEGAAAVAEIIPEAYRRAQTLVRIADRLPDEPHAPKRALVDAVLLAARAEPEPKLRLWQLGEAAELLLDLGETEKAKAVFAEGLPIAQKPGPDAAEFVGYFASRLGRVDLSAALALLGGVERAESHVLPIGNLAARIAASNPPEAERLITRTRGLGRSYAVTVRTCQNMAPADLARARRIAMDLESARMRAGALIFTADGLPSDRRQDARDLVREALTEWDRDRDPSEQLYRRDLAAYMPMVESIDPALVPELFWRAVANLAVADDPRAESGRDDVLGQALLLARYDRQVAAALYKPAVRASAARGADAGQMTPTEIMLLAMLDPQRAVATVEAMPEPAKVDAGEGANWSRIILSEQLGRDDEHYWSRIWQIYSGVGGILGRRDVLF